MRATNALMAFFSSTSFRPRTQSNSSRARITDIARAVKALLQDLPSGSIKFAQLLADVNRKLDKVRQSEE